jgi:hypothetical protein
MFIGIAVWIIAGYIAWRLQYYGLLKWWYLRYKEDYRLWNNGDNAINEWHKPLLIIYITVGGIISLVVIYTCNDDDVCWYFDPNKQ